MMKLQTKRCVLKSILLTDKKFIFEGLSNPKVTQYYGVHYNTLEEVEDQMQWYESLIENKEGHWWKILDLNDGRFMGGIGLSEWSHKNRKAELGFWILPQFWRLGIASEAVAEVLQYAKSEMNLHRIEALVEAPNSACIHTLKKSGFQHEGTMRQCEWKNDNFIDLEVFATLTD